MNYECWLARAKRAEKEAHKILSAHETSPSRVIHLEELSKKLSGAPIDVQDYFREAIACLENGLFRASIVLSWSGYFHVYAEVLFQNYEAALRASRPKWNFRDLAELKEQFAESQLLDVGRDVKYIGRAKVRILQGLLAQRNQCAHPTLYKPSLNVAIGYVDEMVREALKYV